MAKEIKGHSVKLRTTAPNRVVIYTTISRVDPQDMVFVMRPYDVAWTPGLYWFFWEADAEI